MSRRGKNIDIKSQNGTHPFEEEFFENYSADFEKDFDDYEDPNETGVSISDIDFSDLTGNDFKQNLKKFDHRVTVQKNIKLKKSKSGNRLLKKLKKPVPKTHKIIVPSDREVIVQGLSKFILSKHPTDEASKSISYYKGRKLNNLTLIINNEGAVDFTISLFDPTFILDYLWSNSQNINDKITVAGGTTKYTDLVYNILSNPTMIRSAQLVVSGLTQPSITNQFNQAFIFKNKNIAGLLAVEPFQIQLTKDVMQHQDNIVNFDFKALGRPFVPDGMDTISYTVLAGNTVTINFFYKQVQQKRMVFEECRQANNLL